MRRERKLSIHLPAGSYPFCLAESLFHQSLPPLHRLPGFGDVCAVGLGVSAGFL
jgi:hypothetical protein